MVTGAAGGIGTEFCKQLGQKGFNIVLVGRNKENLLKVEKELQDSLVKVKTKIVIADFAESMDPKFYQDIYNQLVDLDISILVNNAGVAMFKHFEQITPQELKEMIYINDGSYAMLTHALINKLLKRSQRSAIINVASIAGMSPISYQGCYSGSKVFVRYFTYSLYDNYKDKIDALAINPGFVETKMIDHTNADMTCTADI